MLKIFIDFDGTITRRDVGDAMFERFGGPQCTQIIEEYRQERISAAECFRQESNACGAVDRSELDAFLDEQEIDSTFPSFTQYCETAGHDIVILSDGMDYYIDRILRCHGLSSVRFFSNHLSMAPAGNPPAVFFKPEFPYPDEVCDRCACCKRNHILSMSGDDDIIVYVGEGYSDRCPARYADLVFAKDELLRYCQQENISYSEYRSFSDIQHRLVEILSQPGKKRLIRKRRQAELARRDVFLGG
jgi:2-hydroxy-3-keto-5-methylthiopentenyl-1-phosphate phosphatase